MQTTRVLAASKNQMAAVAAATAPAAEPMDVSASDNSLSSTTASPSDGGEGVNPSASASMDDTDDDSGPTATLWCSGDNPNSPQQQNFEGVWSLYTAVAAVSQRSVYEHVAPGGMAVYLYFVQQSAATGPCPRWVIGPEPAGDGMNGWAFSDSDASRPEEIIEPWNAWDKDAAAWDALRIAFARKGSVIGRESEVEASDASDDEAAPAVGEGASGGGGATKKKKKGGKKKKDGKASAKKAKGDGKASKAKAKAKS